jgi:nickel-dependent lactate racemase
MACNIAKKDGDLVLVVNSPIGQVIHYVHGRWGIRLYGDLYLPPPNILNEVGRIILYSKHFERLPWLELVPREKNSCNQKLGRNNRRAGK